MIFDAFRRGRRRVPYQMFDHEFHGLEAKNARVLERIYHKGQNQIWDGQEVLQSLIEEHGKPTMPLRVTVSLVVLPPRSGPETLAITQVLPLILMSPSSMLVTC